MTWKLIRLTKIFAYTLIQNHHHNHVRLNYWGVGKNIIETQRYNCRALPKELSFHVPAQNVQHRNFVKLSYPYITKVKHEVCVVTPRSA